MSERTLRIVKLLGVLGAGILWFVSMYVDDRITAAFLLAHGAYGLLLLITLEIIGRDW